MKVETFLQHCISREMFTPEEEADARKFFVGRGVRYIRDWYLQPFKPELITELFEGWEDSWSCSGGYDYIENKKFVFRIMFDWAKIAYILLDPIQSINPFQSMFAKIPSTLDEFISDCLRNGIELKWKVIEVQDGLLF